MKRTALTRRTPLRRGTRRYRKAGEWRARVEALRDKRQAWYEVRNDACALCPTTHGITPHHVVYRQHVRRAGGDEWDPRNALPLCEGCHARHHQRVRVIVVGELPASAVEFANELLGEAAGGYFARYYRAAPAGERAAA